MSKSKIGTIGWVDLTVDNASGVRDFYSRVVGWKSDPVSMGDYDDYTAIPPDGDAPVAGICHKRGTNARIPSKWLMYIIVENLDESLSKCEALGGKIVDGPKDMGKSRYCIIEDPAGAVVALYQE